MRRPGSLDERVAEVAEIAARIGEPPFADVRELPTRGTVAGYAGWAASYDHEPDNDTIAVEEPAVRALLDDLPPGPVLDGACGTGRHAAYLVAAGREVTGVDASPEMLARARGRLPAVELLEGDLAALPVPDATFAGAVCALALAHLPDMGPALAELSRVLRPGGRLVVSNPHPLATGVLGWRAVYTGGGQRLTIPEYPHLHSDYVKGFAAAGLEVRRLIEPRLSAREARARAKHGYEDAFEQALTGLPAVIVWEVERKASSD